MDRPDVSQDKNGTAAVVMAEVVETIPEAAKQAVPSDEGIRQTKRHLAQSANLYVLCVQAVDKLIAPHMPQVAQTSEQFQAAVSSLFIHATRWRLDEKMPVKPL